MCLYLFELASFVVLILISPVLLLVPDSQGLSLSLLLMFLSRSLVSICELLLLKSCGSSICSNQAVVGCIILLFTL